VVDRAGVIVHIEGGALRDVDTTAGDWIGRSLAGTSWWRRGIGPAMGGETVLITGTDPVGGETQQAILYTPRADGTGRIGGVQIFWINVPNGLSVTVNATEGAAHG